MFNIGLQLSRQSKSLVISVVSCFFISLYSCNFSNLSTVNKSSIEVVFDSISFNGKLYLERLDPNTTILVDSIIGGDSKDLVFKITPKQFPDIYILRFSSDQAITIIIDSTSNVKVRISDFPYYSNYSITGSNSSNIIRKNNSILNEHIGVFEHKYSEYRNRKRDDSFDYYRKQTDSILRQNQIELYNKLKESIEHNPKSLASLLAIYSKFGTENIFNIDYDYSTFKLLADSLISAFPKNSHSISFYSSVQKKMVDMELKEERERLLDKGNEYPDIRLFSLDDKYYSIKDTKADIIVIYLWKSKYKAFWEDNVILRKLYDKYDRNKFEIIGISFEKDKLSWSNYCRMEQMNWINLISGPENIDLINPNDIYPRIFVLDSSFNILVKDATIDELELILNK